MTEAWLSKHWVSEVMADHRYVSWSNEKTVLRDTKTKLGKKDVNNSTCFEEIQHHQKKAVNKTASSNNSDKHDLIGFAEVTINVTQFNME